MGTIHHDFAIAVVTFDHDRAEQAFEEVKEFARTRYDAILGTNFDSLLVGPFDGVMNSTTTYLMVPDGSKEWWATSDTGNEVREYFIERMSKVADVAHGSFGELETTFEVIGDE